MIEKNILGKNLRNLRKSKNLRQIDVASSLGIAESSYNKYETGKRRPDFETIKKLSDLFNVTLDFLMKAEYIDTKEYKYLNNENIENSIIIEEHEDYLKTIKGIYYKCFNIPLNKIKIDSSSELGYKNIYCGNKATPIFELENIENNFYFYFPVTDDSMNLNRIYKDDLVLVKMQDKLENNDIALILNEDSKTTIRKVIINDDLIILQAESTNNEFKTYHFKEDEIKNQSIKIIGKIISLKIKF